METDTPAAAPKRKLRWYQYSLRTLLVGVTLFALTCSWFAVKMNQAKKERETVGAIEKLGGEVQYDFWLEGSSIVNAPQHGPAWLRKLLGDDFFDNAQCVDLSKCKDPDAALRLLKDLPHIRNLFIRTPLSDVELTNISGSTQLTFLVLENTKLGDAGVEHLKGLKQLQWLSLANTNLTDEGLKHLKGLSQLKMLDLTGTRVSDAGMDNLKGFNQLSELCLSNTALTDAGMVQLKDLLPQLSLFNVSGTSMSDASLDFLEDKRNILVLGIGNQVSDAGLKKLSGMTQIRGLSLDGTHVTDAGLAYLKGWTQLERLTLPHTRVTDTGLVHLKSMRKLYWIDIEGTLITDAGINELKQSLPKVTVWK